MSADIPKAAAPSRSLVDPGWLFVIAGIVLLLATVLIPAAEQLRRANWQRDRALLVEKHRQERLTRYREFATALERGERSLVLALAASQLNQVPADRTPIGVGKKSGYTDINAGSASIFPNLEPDPIELPEFRHFDSTLSRMVTDDKTRPWIIVVGAVLVFVGVLPASRSKG
jgi:hypothetical protein